MYNYPILDIRNIVTAASNIKSILHNPPFTREQFLEIYPQFTQVNESVYTLYFKMANASISYGRWGDAWELGMCLFIAHYLTLYLQITNGLDENSPAYKVIQNSISQGLVSSKSAGSLSKSYEYGSINDDLDGYADFKLTVFGQQFTRMAKLMGKGGSLIW